MLGHPAIERLDDWWQRWRGDTRAGVVALVAVALVVGVLWYRIGASGTPAASATSSQHTSSRSAGSRQDSTSPPSISVSTTSVPTVVTGSTVPTRAVGTTTATTRGRSSAGTIVVHVAGAVAHPGVVELPLGARVIDAIEAVGGGLPNADLDRLNLAATLVDGQRVLMARIGDPAEAAIGTGSTASSEASGPLNLNTATQDQLDELPGIGPQLAAAIIKERDRRGGFRSVNELSSVRGIGDKRLADLRELVTV